MTDFDFNVVAGISVVAAILVYLGRASEFNFLAFLIIYGLCFPIVLLGYWLVKVMAT